MKEHLLKTGWRQRIVRIRESYIDICLYLEFYASKIQIDKKKIFDEVFNFSINHISENGFKYNISAYDKKRTPKGFLIDNNTSNDLDKYYDFYREILFKKEYKKLYFAEFVELLIYIYCVNHLEKSELKLLENKFGITIKE